jgi:hypothetical protein
MVISARRCVRVGGEGGDSSRAGLLHAGIVTVERWARRLRIRMPQVSPGAAAKTLLPATWRSSRCTPKRGRLRRAHRAGGRRAAP